MQEIKNFAWPITSTSKENYKIIVEWAKSRSDLKDKRIVIFGAGIRGTEIAVILETIGFENLVFTDNNKEKWGGVIDKYPIISVEKALQMKSEVLYLISVEEGEGICKQLEQYGLKKDRDFFFPRPNLYENFINEFKRKTSKVPLIVGDCMFEVISFDDDNKDSLTEIIQKHFGIENIKMLTMHGMGLPTFYHVLKAQINCGIPPSVFVVMLNFETLNGKQHLLPRSQHTELVENIYKISPDPDGELKRYVEITKERVKNVQSEFFTTNKFSNAVKSNNNRGEISDAASKVFLKLNYLYRLNTEIESLNYLKKIMDLGHQNHITILPFIPPVNYERGNELFGKKFEEIYQENLNKINRIVDEQGFSLLDLSHICTKDEFAHVTTPDETMNYKGRLKAADAIYNAVKKIGE